jgi:hypothetical protein
MDTNNKSTKIPKPSYSTPAQISLEKEALMQQVEEKAAKKELIRLHGVDSSSSFKQIPSEFYPDQKETKVLTVRTTSRIKGLLDLVARKEKETDRQKTMYNVINDALSSHSMKKLAEYGYDTSTLRIP